MGATRVTVTIRNPAKPDQVWDGLFLVDTGVMDCRIPRQYLESVGLAPLGSRTCRLSDGSLIRMDATVAVIEFMGEIVGGTIIMTNADTEPLLGLIPLQSAGIELDPQTQTLKKLPSVRLKVLQGLTAT